MSQYYYIINDRPDKRMKYIKPVIKQSFPCKMVSTAKPAEETIEVKEEAVVVEPVTEVVVETAPETVAVEVTEETPKKKRRSRKKTEEVEVVSEEVSEETPVAEVESAE